MAKKKIQLKVKKPKGAAAGCDHSFKIVSDQRNDPRVGTAVYLCLKCGAKETR